MADNAWVTAIGEVGHGVIRVRGYPIEEVISRLSFGEATYLTIRGELPTAAQARLMDAALCSILEHGLYAPTTYAARIVSSAAPHSIMPGVAAGALTVGSVTVSPQDTAEIILSVRRAVEAGATAEGASAGVARGLIESGSRLPGVGHPLHPEGDPRAGALLQVAERNGLRTELTGYYMLVRECYLAQTGRNLPVNIDGMLGCVLTELGFLPLEMPGIALMSFLPGVIAHCTEEIVSKSLLRVENADYVGRAARSMTGRADEGASAS